MFSSDFGPSDHIGSDRFCRKRGPNQVPFFALRSVCWLSFGALQAMGGSLYVRSLSVGSQYLFDVDL